MTVQPKHSLVADTVDQTRRILGFIEWLSSDDCRGLDEIGFVAETANRVLQLGLPVDRLILHQMTLHPDAIGRTIAWAPREPMEVYDRRNGNQLPTGRLRKTLESGELLTAPPDNSWKDLDIYAGRALSQLLLAPMTSADGVLGVLVFGTTRPHGFEGSEAAMLERLVPVLRTAVELKILKQTELGLLDTHLGQATAGRVLARRLRRREIETLEGAMLLCDLTATTADSSIAPETVIDILDQSRSVALSTMKANGAEIIEISADRIMAVYPAGDPSDAARRAFVSAADILHALEASDGGTSASLTAHYGELTYGSVGYGNSTRLVVVGGDFDVLNRMSNIRKSYPRGWTASQHLLELLEDDVRASVSGVNIVDTERMVRHPMSMADL